MLNLSCYTVKEQRRLSTEKPSWVLYNETSMIRVRKRFKTEVRMNQFLRADYFFPFLIIC